MRITHRMIIDNAIRSMSKNLDKMGSLQSKAASGKRLDKSSDAPQASRVILALQSNINANTSYLETVDAAENWLSASGIALEGLEELANKAVNTALEGISDTYEDARANLAEELDSFIEDAISLGNSKHQDNYLFSGYDVKTTQ